MRTIIMSPPPGFLYCDPVCSAAVGTTDKEGRFTLVPMSSGAAVSGAKEGVYAVSISKTEADLSVWNTPTDAPASPFGNKLAVLNMPYSNDSFLARGDRILSVR